MSVEKITSRILEDARANAEEMVAQAEKEKQQILSDARADAEGIAAEILANARRQIQTNLQRAQSMADLEGKKETLQAKQDCILQVYRMALTRLTEMDETEYFSLLKRMLAKINPQEPARIQFNERDSKRFPKSGWAEFPVTLSETAGKFEAGFILHMGQTSINCTFDEILRSVLENHKKEIADILFRN